MTDKATTIDIGPQPRRSEDDNVTDVEDHPVDGSTLKSQSPPVQGKTRLSLVQCCNVASLQTRAFLIR